MNSLSRRSVLLVLGGTLLMPFRVARGHHGWGSYDAEEPVQVSGLIEAISYDWPHAEMRLMSGNTAWQVILGPPSRTRRRGLTEEMASIGSEATVQGYVHRSHPDEIRVEWVAIDGERYMMR